MRICDICLKEEAPPVNSKYGFDMCDTCANKNYQHAVELQKQYREEQKEKPLSTQNIKKIQPITNTPQKEPEQLPNPEPEPTPEPINHTINLTESMNIGDTGDTGATK